MTSLLELANRWRSEAGLLRSYGAEEAAAAAEKHAGELLTVVQEAEDELLSPMEAAKVSGLSTRRLRELRAEGKLKNYGREGAPRYRRGQLPLKVLGTAAPSDFDPSAEAAKIIGSNGLE